MSTALTFIKKGHDDFIDFVKAYAIICVLIGHTFTPFLDKIGYGVWAGMQVPLFILIQTFHSYKKEKITFSIKKVWRRVLVPFFVIEIITSTFVFLCGFCEFKYLIHKMLSGGGYGPGSYYPWIYLQISLLLPLFAIALQRYSKIESFFIFLTICESFEILFSFAKLPDSIYRLLTVRYIFLIWLGWQWAKEGIKLNITTVILSIVSLISIIYFEYLSLDDEPWFYNTVWKYHRWPCYFFVANLFMLILHKLWLYINRHAFISKLVAKIAACSYEIFLIQMMVLFILKESKLYLINRGTLIDATYFLYIIFVWIISIIGGYLLNTFVNSKFKRYRLRLCEADMKLDVGTLGMSNV